MLVIGFWSYFENIREKVRKERVNSYKNELKRSKKVAKTAFSHLDKKVSQKVIYILLLVTDNEIDDDEFSPSFDILKEIDDPTLEHFSNILRSEYGISLDLNRESLVLGDIIYMVSYRVNTTLKNNNKT